MREQTAVEWLENILHDFIHPEHGAEFFPFVEQAKAMEKEQILNAIELTIEREYFEQTWANCASVSIMAEQYYHEIYGTDSN